MGVRGLGLSLNFDRRYFLKTLCFTSGQNSVQAFAGDFAEYAVTGCGLSAALVLDSLLTRQVLEENCCRGWRCNARTPGSFCPDGCAR